MTETTAPTHHPLPGPAENAAETTRADAAARPDAPRIWAALLETAKPGITRLVTITAIIGFAFEALASRELTLLEFLARGLVVIVGAGLTSAGANALNMWMEPDRDARMRRTEKRPIPAGILTPNTVLLWGLTLSAVGTLALLILIGPAPGLAALAGVVLYVLVYTPLKPHTVWNTLVGAVPGAVPPLIGAAAATNAPGLEPLLRPTGWSIFLLMLVWQIPHFLAIAWIYRDEYARAGLRMLPSIDRTGEATSFTVILSSIALLAVSLAPALAAPDIVGGVYIVFAVVSGLAYLWLAIRLADNRDNKSAKAVFFASIAHLPLLLLVLLAEGAARGLIAG